MGTINSKMLNNLRYADDTTLIAKNEEGMARMLGGRVVDESRTLGLEITFDKTKLMVIDRSNALQINNLPPNIETVNDFIYLGSRLQGGDKKTYSTIASSYGEPGKDMDRQRDNQKDKNGSGEIFGVLYIFVRIRGKSWVIYNIFLVTICNN